MRADIDIVAHITPHAVEALAYKLRTIDKLVYVDEDAMREAIQDKSEL